MQYSDHFFLKIDKYHIDLHIYSEKALCSLNVWHLEKLNQFVVKVNFYRPHAKYDGR